MRLSNVLGFVVVSVSVSASVGASATLVDTTNFTETALVTTPSNATSMAWAPDGSGRLFVAQKEGRISIVKNGVLLPTPFATEPVYTVNESGLVGIAFDPNFVQNGFVYLFEAVSANTQQVVRLTASGDVGGSRTLIIDNLPTAAFNHNGGGLGFGPDGKLYWGVGDNGNGTGVNADLSSLGAKIGRANRDGSVPANNPFNDGAGPNNDYVWARGFKNPFAFAFQPATGALWVDVPGNNYEQVFVVTAGSHAGYNLYEDNQPAGFLTPTVVYRTNGSDTLTLAAAGGAVRSGGIATFTTAVAHGLRKGSKVTIAGVTDSSFNGSGYVLAAPSATTFTLTQAGANASSGGGNATTLNLGGAATGGDFWSTSALPAAYRGNYFFGDYNSGRVARVTLAGDNSVSSVDYFASNLAQAVDVAAGPDGALYVLGLVGDLHRISFNAAAQGIVASPLQVRLDEGGRAVVSVRLAKAPAANVSVTASVTGDSDLAIVTGASLTFTAANWSTPQTVLLRSAADLDSTEDLASLTLSASSLPAETIELRATDANVASATSAASVAAGQPRTVALLGALLLAAGAVTLERVKRRRA